MKALRPEPRDAVPLDRGKHSGGSEPEHSPVGSAADDASLRVTRRLAGRPVAISRRPPGGRRGVWQAARASSASRPTTNCDIPVDRSLSSSTTTIDVVGLRHDVLGLFRRKEHQHAGEILGRAHAAEGHAPRRRGASSRRPGGSGYLAKSASTCSQCSPSTTPGPMALTRTRLSILFPRILETVTAAERANYFAEAGCDPI